MSFAIRLIQTTDIANVVALINESSLGLSFELRLDRTKFLALSSFWNFSYRHSYIAFMAQEPAGVVINSVDLEGRESYSYYWGVMPRFRGTGLGLNLAKAYLSQVAREGFSATYAEASSDSPNAIYQRLGFNIAQFAVEMECPNFGLEDKQQLSEYTVRHMELNEFLQESTGLRKEPLCWIQRPNALRNAARFLRFASCGSASAAYQAGSEETVVIDFQFDPADTPAAQTLITYLASKAFPRPCKISSIRTDSPLHTLLLKCRFIPTRRATCLTLDLDRWRARALKRAFSA
jgi:hypothetical protein